jgi:NADPH:quinone reductase-like Zn-dependent oxidoreductase
MSQVLTDIQEDSEGGTVMEEIGAVGMTEKPVPVSGPDDAIVETIAALICTSDSPTVAGGIGPRTDLAPGHEAVGDVSDDGVLGEHSLDASLCAGASPLGLLSEQIDPSRGERTGNFPQAFGHIGVIAGGVTLARATRTVK